MQGACPMGEFVAIFQSVHTHRVAAYDLKTAAAIAAALAQTHGWKLMSVQTAESLKQEQK